MIYFFNGLDTVPNELFRKLLPSLPIQRQEYILHYRRIEDQKRSAFGWLLLCYGLYQEYSISTLPPLGFTSHGKPFFARTCSGTESFPFFNISHSGTFAACAVHDEEIGLDIQKFTIPRPSLIRRVCTKEELASVKSPADFCRIWTRKESAVKLTGEGITGQFRDILTLHPDIHTTSVPLENEAGYLSYSIYGTCPIPVVSVSARQLLNISAI